MIVKKSEKYKVSVRVYTEGDNEVVQAFEINFTYGKIRNAHKSPICRDNLLPIGTKMKL